MPGAPIKKYPLQMDALPVPRGWVPDAWFKAYNAADSQIYKLVGKDCRISKRKRDSGETRERALRLWEKYPMNKMMWAERGKEEGGTEVAEVAVMEEDQEESESEDESGEDEEDEREGGDVESGGEQEVGERGVERVWEQEVEESEEGEDEEVVEEMDEDGDSSEEAYDVSYLFEDF